MMRIRFPVRRFASAGDHHAGSERSPVWSGFDGRGQMHQTGDTAKHALGVINQPDELAQIGLTAQVDNTLQRRVMMPHRAHLDELNPVFEAVDDRLIPTNIPPLYRAIVFAPRADDPKRDVLPGDFVDLRVPGFLGRRKMNIAPKKLWTVRMVEALAQERGEPVQGVIRCAIGLVDQRIIAFNDPYGGILLGKGRYIGVVFPKLGAGGPYIREEPVGIGEMQVPHGRGQQDDIPRREGAPKYKCPTHTPSAQCGKNQPLGPDQAVLQSAPLDLDRG